MRADQLDIRRLRGFQLVARHGSLRLAAGRLNLTPSAVSIQISRLEGDLGVKLFERLPNKIILTTAGTRFLHRVDMLLEQAEAAIADLEAEKVVGRLSISIGSDNSATFAPVISQYVASRPGVDLSLNVLRSRDAIAALQQGEIELAIGIFPGKHRGIRTEPLTQTTLSLLYKEHHPLASWRKLVLRDVACQRLIIPPQWTETRKLIDAAFAKSAVCYENFIEVINCATAITFARSGVGVALLHSSCIRSSATEGVRWRDLGPRFGYIEISMAYRATTSNSQIVGGLMDALRRQGSETD